MNRNTKRFMSEILAVLVAVGGGISAQKRVYKYRSQLPLRRVTYGVSRNLQNSKSIMLAEKKKFKRDKQRMNLKKTQNSFSSLEFWLWLTTTGILGAGGAGTVSHFAAKKLCNDKRSGYLYLAEKLGLLSNLEKYGSTKKDYDVMSMVNSIMPIYDELCSFVSNLSLDFDPEKLEAKFGIKDTESEFYKSHVSDFNFLKSWTFKFKIGRQSELQIVDHIYVDDIGCSYSGNYKWRGTQFLEFENNSWKFYGGYGFSQPVPKVYENASDEQKKNLRCGDFRGLFKDLARDVISEWLLCMWIYPIYDDECFFDCCIRREDSCLEFVSSLMK